MLNAQKISHISIASTSNPNFKSGLSTKQKSTLTILGQALQKEKLLKQAKANAHIAKSWYGGQNLKLLERIYLVSCLGLLIMGHGLSVRRCCPKTIDWAKYVYWLLFVDCYELGAIGQLFLVDNCK